MSRDAAPDPGRSAPSVRGPIRLLEHRVALWLVGLGVAMGAAVITTTQLYLSWRAEGRVVALVPLFVTEFVEWGSWLLVFPVILAWDRRAGFVRYGWSLRAIGSHALLLAVFFGIQNAVLVAMKPLGSQYQTLTRAEFVEFFVWRLPIKLPTAILLYAALLGVAWVFRLYVAYHDQALRATDLDAKLAEARFAHLSAQLRPHFLFNALHLIGGLVRRGERDLAVESLAELSELLRRSLEAGDEQEVALRTELEFVDGYLRIQRSRFGDRLEVERDIEPGLDEARVPSLLLQPLIENAVRHGLDLDHEPGRVRIRARSGDGTLELAVEDNGSGFAPGDEGTPTGLGLGHTRERLAQLYGDAAEVRVWSEPGAGTRVEVVLPYGAVARPTNDEASDASESDRAEPDNVESGPPHSPSV